MTDIESKIQEYLQQLESNPESAEIHASLSSLYAQKQQWQEAIIAAQKAISLNPNFAGAYRNLARILTKLGKENAATECWLKAYSLEPERANAAEFCRLGNLFLQQKKLDRAFTCFLQALKLESDFTEAYRKLGVILTRQGKYNDATEVYRKAIEFSPRHSDIQKQIFGEYLDNLVVNPKTTAKDYYELGKLLRSQNFITEAIIAYQQSIRLDPLLLLPHSDLSYTTIPKDRLPDLVEFYRKVVDENPNLSLAWSNLGDFLSRAGKPEEAIPCYQKSCYHKTVANRPYLAAWMWEKQRNCAPNFVIAGATKCGTTSLYMYLEKHPQIIVSRKKEINFFNFNFSYGAAWYLSQFPSIDDRNFITGEASPNYLDCPKSARNMHELFPEMKIIILLRNPIEKAVSWHYHKLNQGIALNNNSLREEIEAEMEVLSSWSEEQLIRSNYHYPNNLLGSLYYYRLQSWFDRFSREQILILKSEDFYQNTPVVMEEVYQFLGLEPHRTAKYPICNSGNYTPIDPELREVLADYFQPYNRKLEKFLGRKFNWS
jgi:tetratricopeptide (TPR) repeat protein